MPTTKYYPVTSGWQWRVILEDRIFGGWAPTPEAAKKKIDEKLETYS